MIHNDQQLTRVDVHAQQHPRSIRRTFLRRPAGHCRCVVIVAIVGEIKALHQLGNSADVLLATKRRGFGT